LIFVGYLETQTNHQADDIYELLGRSINQLVKYFDEPEKKVNRRICLVLKKEELIDLERIDNTDSMW
jgi:hypothetical protein